MEYLNALFYCKIRCGRDYALFLLLRALMEQIPTFVAKQAMSQIRVFLLLSCLDSNLTQISQIWHQGCQLCLLCGNTGCPVVVLLLNMKCVVTVAPYPWRYFGPPHLRQKEPLESKIEPLGNYMSIGAINKLTLSGLSACCWPFLTTFLRIFLTCATDTFLQGVYKYFAGPKGDF